MLSEDACSVRRQFHSLTFSILRFGLANRAALQAVDESFPERPALFFGFVLPSRSKHLFLNLWIADPHTTTPILNGLEDPNGLCKERVSIRFCSRDDEYCNWGDRWGEKIDPRSGMATSYPDQRTVHLMNTKISSASSIPSLTLSPPPSNQWCRFLDRWIPI